MKKNHPLSKENARSIIVQRLFSINQYLFMLKELENFNQNITCIDQKNNILREIRQKIKQLISAYGDFKRDAKHAEIEEFCKDFPFLANNLLEQEQDIISCISETAYGMENSNPVETLNSLSKAQKIIKTILAEQIEYSQHTRSPYLTMENYTNVTVHLYNLKQLLPILLSDRKNKDNITRTFALSNISNIYAYFTSLQDNECENIKEIINILENIHLVNNDTLPRYLSIIDAVEENFATLSRKEDPPSLREKLRDIPVTDNTATTAKHNASNISAGLRGILAYDANISDFTKRPIILTNENKATIGIFSTGYLLGATGIVAAIIKKGLPLFARPKEITHFILIVINMLTSLASMLAFVAATCLVVFAACRFYFSITNHYKEKKSLPNAVDNTKKIITQILTSQYPLSAQDRSDLSATISDLDDLLLNINKNTNKAQLPTIQIMKIIHDLEKFEKTIDTINLSHAYKHLLDLKEKPKTGFIAWITSWFIKPTVSQIPTKTDREDANHPALAPVTAIVHSETSGAPAPASADTRDKAAPPPKPQ